MTLWGWSDCLKVIVELEWRTLADRKLRYLTKLTH